MRSLGMILAAMLALQTSVYGIDFGSELAGVFAETVDPRLTLPAQEQQSYAGLLAGAVKRPDWARQRP